MEVVRDPHLGEAVLLGELRLLDQVAGAVLLGGQEEAELGHERSS
jgi:hypothetical protein